MGCRCGRLVRGKVAIKPQTDETAQNTRKTTGGSVNVAFGDLCRLVEAFGFRLARISGSHHIYTHPEIPDLVNLQNDRGQAKPYQIRQFLKLVEEYNLKLEDDTP